MILSSYQWQIEIDVVKNDMIISLRSSHLIIWWSSNKHNLFLCFGLVSNLRPRWTGQQHTNDTTFNKTKTQPDFKKTHLIPPFWPDEYVRWIFIFPQCMMDATVNKLQLDRNQCHKKLARLLENSISHEFSRLPIAVGQDVCFEGEGGELLHLPRVFPLHSCQVATATHLRLKTSLFPPASSSTCS